jgi:hypothetical protein
MSPEAARTSARAKARLAGFLYLLIALGAPFAEFYVRSGVIVRGDAAATAANILANETLYRLGGAFDLIVLACDVAVALLFYELLKPVSRTIALLAAFFRLALVAVNGANALTHFAPLFLLGDAAYLAAFTPEQLQALALTSLRLHTTGFTVALFFFGFNCLAMGWLIWRSAFLPRILGPLMAVAGLCYLVSSFTGLALPSLRAAIGLFILAPAGVAELSLLVWLIVFGVNEERWHEQAHAARSGGGPAPDERP